MTATEPQILFDYDAASKTLAWYEQGCPASQVDAIACLPANQLMQQVNLQYGETDILLLDAMQEYDPAAAAEGDPYLLHRAYSRHKEISRLLSAIREENLATQAYARARQFFPVDAQAAPGEIKVYFALLGWDYGDALQLRYTQDNGQCSISEEGAPAVLFNLTLVDMLYGEAVPDRLSALQDVMAHELFHALLDEYARTSWLGDQSLDTFEGYTTYILFNEGLAHYIADQATIGDKYINDPTWRVHEQQAFEALAANISVLFDKEIAAEEKRPVLNSGVSGDFWDKYLAISGMFMAMHIERELGAKALTDCVVDGPQRFIQTYHDLTWNKDNVPQLPDQIVSTTVNR